MCAFAEEEWFSGRCAVSSDRVANLARHDPRVLAMVLRLLRQAVHDSRATSWRPARDCPLPSIYTEKQVPICSIVD